MFVINGSMFKFKSYSDFLTLSSFEVIFESVVNGQN